MQPYLFPYLGYFQLINAVDEYVIYDDVQFIKGGWINRNNILVDGAKTLVTLPLVGASSNKMINEIEISRQKLPDFIESIETAYRDAPYFNDVMNLVKQIAGFPDNNLGAFVGKSVQLISSYLNINTRYLYSSALSKNSSLKGQDKVIDICTTLDANTYINAIGGQGLYDKSAFLGYSIELKFLKTSLRPYRQFNSEFVSGLSIIDVMMFNSADTLKEMLGDYELI